MNSDTYPPCYMYTTSGNCGGIYKTSSLALRNVKRVHFMSVVAKEL